MPMGITADIYEGKDVTLRDYLMRVGRSMSMAIMQRDSDQDEPVKLRQESSYERKRVAETRTKLARLQTLTEEQAEAEARREDAERAETLEKREREARELRERYEAMLAQVEQWEPDPKVAYVKEHAIKYLRESIQFDCPEDATRYYPQPEGLTGAEWLAQRLLEAQENVVRAEQRLREEVERVADFNEHIEAFLRSLPPADAPVHA